MLSFKLRIGKVKTDQTTGEFIVICQKKKKEYRKPHKNTTKTNIKTHQEFNYLREELQLDNHICMEDRQEKARTKIEYKPDERANNKLLKKNESKMNTKQNKRDIIFSGPTEVTQHDPPELLV